MNKIYNKILVIFSVIMILQTTHAEELLRNGGFENGIAEEREPASFICKGWHRQLWNPKTRKSWLVSGKYDRNVGKDNNAIVFCWGATSVYQDFSAVENSEYVFKVDFKLTNKDSRWEPRIRVEWYNSKGSKIDNETTIAKTEKGKTEARKWIPLKGSATSPAGTAYGRILLDVFNTGTGPCFVRQYLDNASVTGLKGTSNLPVYFDSAPYDMNLTPITEQKSFSGTFTDYTDDGNGDKLTFTRLDGPEWLKVSRDGSFTGKPEFKNAGNNIFTIKVEDSKGSSDTRKITIPVLGLLKIAHVFGKDMVIQRDYPIPVWGTALPNQKVIVELGKGCCETTSDSDGKWAVSLPAMSSSAKETLVVKCGPRTIELPVAVGDVWMCSGQSNMSLPLNHTDNALAEIAKSANPDLHFVTTPFSRLSAPATELLLAAEWSTASPKTTPDFSSVAYYFGKKLQSELGIPIGLISSNQGGTPIETWVRGLGRPREKLLYNGMIHPYTRQPIKGVIWYQGEANVKDGDQYIAKMEKLANEWRHAWNIGDFPIYFVQLASFRYPKNTQTTLPKMWVAQADAAEKIKNCGMVVINDISNISSMHPTNKAPVGGRLVRMALCSTYGKKDLIPCGPIARNVKRIGDALCVSFEYSGKGLKSRDGKALSYFEIAGSDGNYIKADAVAKGNSVLVSSPKIKEPVSVRFAWTDTAEPNLVNSDNLPTGAFELMVK